MTIAMSFLLSIDQEDDLLAAEDDDEVLEVLEEVEEGVGPRVDFDKSWDALHRCLTDGTLDVDDDAPPIARAVLGGDLLLDDEDHELVRFTEAADVPAVALALAGMTRERLTELYWSLLPEDYSPEYGEDDLECTLDTLKPLQAFWNSAAAAGRSVVFSVSL